MQASPFDVVKNFEKELCLYTGAPFAVTTNSCTMALLLCCVWAKRKLGYTPSFLIPNRTYVGVPMAIRLAGGEVFFHDEEWSGEYELDVVPHTRHFTIWDSARRFRKNMFPPQEQLERFKGEYTLDPPEWWPARVAFQCVSFHSSKILGDTQGGCILHNDKEADTWLRRARFDGRTEGVHPRDDIFDMLGYHCYLSVDVAARLLWKLSTLPDYNEDLPNSDYPDLSLAPIFGGSV